MNKRNESSPKFAPLSRNRTRFIGACVCAAVAVQAAPAHAQAVTDGDVTVVIPNHLALGNRIFDGSVTGLRDYLESIRTTNPQLYGQLAPDVANLEAQRTASRAVLVTGLVAGAASMLYAFAGQGSCQEPSLSDPHFAADSQAWGACNQHKIDMMALFGFLGVAAITAGAVGGYALAPSRSDLLEVVDKNNRLSPEPLRLQLGYDPSHQLAFAGATLAF
ncbi:MAG TPA: hypothetical protein VKZ18_20925 [Polyangia bacterium]|nr:hypothetical protein [Polyangia bacterium]